MFLLKYELESLGHNVEDWGAGFNHGDVPVLALLHNKTNNAGR